MINLIKKIPKSSNIHNLYGHISVCYYFKQKKNLKSERFWPLQFEIFLIGKLY